VETSELPPPSATAERYIERALEIIEANAVTRGQLDWPIYRRSVLEQARGAESIEDSYLALRFALSSLGDQHSYQMTSRQLDSLAERPFGNASTGREPIAPRGEMLTGSIAYLMLPGFAGGAHGDQVQFAEALHGVIADLDGQAACGWIVDLRNNSGGNLWPMLAGIGPLLGDGEAGASVRPNGERTELWYRDGKVGLGDYVQLRVAGDPYRLRETNAPVAVLTGRSTASAAEIVATAFEARAGTRSFGAATSGATTGTQIFPLSDGAALVLAVAATSDRNGRIYSGRIEPDVAVAGDERGIELRDQAAVHAASQWLKTQEACVKTSRL
jgi:C-terminal processing protease CtpA/Prc